MKTGFQRSSQGIRLVDSMAAIRNQRLAGVAEAVKMAFAISSERVASETPSSLPRSATDTICVRSWSRLRSTIDWRRLSDIDRDDSCVLLPLSQLLPLRVLSATEPLPSFPAGNTRNRVRPTELHANSDLRESLHDAISPLVQFLTIQIV